MFAPYWGHNTYRVLLILELDDKAVLFNGDTIGIVSPIR